MNILFIGYGNMAKALITGLSKQKNVTLFASAPSLSPSINQLGVHTHPDNNHFIARANLIILAIKPAQVPVVLSSMKQEIMRDCVIISLAAGIAINDLQNALPPQQAIVRAMPNTPIAVGQGVVVFFANSHLTPRQHEQINTLFSPLSLTFWIQKEQMMDTITALSGSGPAYVYLFIEALTAGAESLGLPADLATALSQKTVKGALSLLEKSGKTPSELRQQVTSKGGTTAAALDVLQAHHFQQLILDALTAAKKRAEAMNAETKTFFIQQNQ